jgi:hypothetical protein
VKIEPPRRQERKEINGGCRAIRLFEEAQFKTLRPCSTAEPTFALLGFAFFFALSVAVSLQSRLNSYATLLILDGCMPGSVLLQLMRQVRISNGFGA